MATKKSATRTTKTAGTKSATKTTAKKSATSKPPKTSTTKPAAARPQKATAKANDRDPRLPSAGTVITRKFKDKTYEVKVSESDFEFRGRKFASLSAIAKEITGAQTNGFLWFGLIKRPAKKDAA
jgi:hypothetical protein